LMLLVLLGQKVWVSIKGSQKSIGAKWWPKEWREIGH
jgi:hypothetical protein